jgi:tetrapyrrole methylase family protein/MazG family protein
VTNTSLVVVGSGIKFMSHITTEARAYIVKSDCVLYLVNEPATREWIQQTNPNSESLEKLYSQHPLRQQNYQAITDYILEKVREQQHVCVVMYGHPVVFAQPALNAAIQAKAEGYFAKVLPGISAEDCLFADLLIDPSSCGCMSVEATDFLLHNRNFSANSHLIIWQVGMIGGLGHVSLHDNSKGIHLLVKHLQLQYPDTHPVTLYEAAQYPHFEPHIQCLPLKQLPDISISHIATLYVPPAIKAHTDPTMLNALGIHLETLTLAEEVACQGEI